jgi:DNA-binding NarL/FixJ family response regulator
MAIEILIADDHLLLRQGLRALLRGHSDMRIVAEAGDGAEAVRLAAEFSPHVVVMDVAMPVLDGVEATRQILERNPATKVVMVSLYCADRPLIIEGFRAGASGYLPKEASVDELVTAIRTVMQDKVYVSPTLHDTVMQTLRRPDARGSAEWLLTAREREVLQQLAEGYAMKQIAVNLDVSVKTIETHRRQIMDKLGMHSVAELTKYAIRHGLTTAEPNGQPQFGTAG